MSPRFRGGDETATKRGECVPCPPGTFNLASQFQPLHQKGVYAESGHYYTASSLANPLTCETDPDETDEDGRGCGDRTFLDELGDVQVFVVEENTCNTKSGCLWYPDEVCAFRDPCVRKAKRTCNSASHCQWDRETGMCKKGLRADFETKCNRKNLNGCINDNYCKWDRTQGCIVHGCRFKDMEDCLVTKSTVAPFHKCDWNYKESRCDSNNGGGIYQNGREEGWGFVKGEFVYLAENNGELEEVITAAGTTGTEEYV